MNTICDFCLTYFEYKKEDVTRDKDGYYVICPGCGHDNDVYDYEDYSLESLEEDNDTYSEYEQFIRDYYGNTEQEGEYLSETEGQPPLASIR